MAKKKNIAKGWLKRFEDIMAASAFAEEDLPQTATEILKEKKKVLLTLTGEDSDNKSFKYALNICKRLKTGLEILSVEKSSKMTVLLNEFRRELENEGIDCKIIQKSGCIKEVITEHTEKNKEILFAIVGTQQELNIGCDSGKKSFSSEWKKLKCPLVVVSKGEMPSTA